MNLNVTCSAVVTKRPPQHGEVTMLHVLNNPHGVVGKRHQCHLFDGVSLWRHELPGSLNLKTDVDVHICDGVTPPNDPSSATRPTEDSK
jgi:hypothetical protein